MMRSKYDLIMVTGPTASGKTAVAASLAHTLDSEVISADSRQVYRGMDIGTGKDYADYIIDGKEVPKHLIDIVDPGYNYNVYEYQRDFLNVYLKLRGKKIEPVVCGGSGMYIDSIISGYTLIKVPPNAMLREELDKLGLPELKSRLESYRELHNRSDTGSRKRAVRAIEIQEYYMNNPPPGDSFPDLNALIIGVKYDRESRRERISSRLKARLEEGMIDEVKGLMNGGISAEKLIYYGLEYKYVTLYITGELGYQEMYSKLETAIHQFAKRQMTWFRGMERKGKKIHWLDGHQPMDQKIERIMKLTEL